MKWEILVKEIIEKRIDTKEINNYLKKNKKIKTKSDKINFLKECIKEHRFLGNYVQNEFLKCASPTKEFSKFVEFVIEYDLYMIELPAYAEIYKKNKKVFEFLCLEFSKSKNVAISSRLGIILSGMGRFEPEKMFHILNKESYPNNFEHILINAVSRTKRYQKIPKKIFGEILQYTDSKDENIKRKAIHLLMNEFNKNKISQKKLLDLVKSDDKTKIWINRLIIGISSENPSLCIKLKQQCFKQSNKNLRKEIALDLGHIAPKYPTECLILIKEIIKEEDSPVLHQSIGWSLEEIGKGKKYAEIEKILYEWIRTEKSKTLIRFTLPKILKEIYSSNGNRFLALLKKINYKQKNQTIIIARSLETYLSENDVEAKSKKFQETVKKLLLKIAEYHNIDTTIDGRLNDPRMQNLALIENINHHRKKIDPKIAKSNLKHYPNIIEFIGKIKINHLIEELPYHPLVRLLHRSQVTKRTINKYTNAIIKESDTQMQKFMYRSLQDQFHPDMILEDLDKSLENIGNVNSKEIRQMLLDPYKFDSAIIQATMFSRIKQKDHDVELDPTVENNKLDLLMTMDKQEYYFEIYTPEENKKIRYMSVAQNIDTEHTKIKISQKLKGQLKAANNLNKPVIVVIDNQNMVIDEMDIENALYGTYQWTVLWDKKTGKEVKSYPTRRDDSLGKKLEHGDVISAIMIIRSSVDNNDSSIKIFGKTIRNPYAKVPLDEKIIKKIENVLFETSL